MGLLNKYSLGIGDRFAQEAQAQLEAVIQAQKAGMLISPVWNKSFREHQIIGSSPQETARAAEEATAALQWTEPYFLDADHINKKTLGYFVEYCNYFTIDVTEALNKPLSGPETTDLKRLIKRLGQRTQIADLHPFEWNETTVENFLSAYGKALLEARQIATDILKVKARNSVVLEVSFDEGPKSQTPAELFLLLHVLTELGVRLNTIAPKFVGDFLKGIDYRGSLSEFSDQVRDFLKVLRWFQQNKEQPEDLKLSIHTGSDKFSLYPILRRLIREFDTGLHLKTAGTTWLEEIIGLAESGPEGLQFIKTLYALAWQNKEQLSRPYQNVIRIQYEQLPSPAEVESWDEQRLVRTVRHNPQDPFFDANVRQLLHIAYGLASRESKAFFSLLKKYRSTIEKNVILNLFERHIKPLFLGKE